MSPGRRGVERERLGRGLGRRVSLDARDTNYPVTAILPRRIELTRKYWWANGAWYDQGTTGTCVGHAWAHFAEDSPVTHPDEMVDPYRVYRRACKLDPWSENDGGNLSFGTTVRAGAQAMVGFGFLNEYRWAFTVPEIRDTVLTMGPMVIGVDWFESMFYPRSKLDAAGTRRMFLDVDPSSGDAGGHALLVDGVSVPGKCFRLKNSWGRTWGADGFASIHFDDMALLLNRDGEACIAREVKRAA